jgi:diguanylate cyclase (GGDEF)-like protein/PAS domain S-box-containing protein
MRSEQKILDLTAQLEEAISSQAELLELLAHYQGVAEHYKDIFELSSVGRFITDFNGKICNANIKACELLACKKGFLLERSLFSFVNTKDTTAFHEILMEHFHYVKSGKVTLKCEVKFKNKWCAVHSCLLSEDLILSTVIDISVRKKLEDKVIHNSTHDSLTGVYNRAFFTSELERLSRSRLFPITIVNSDINDLKKVNDTKGHKAGDALIKLAASVLVASFRAEDVIARLGGDEFVVLLPNTTEEQAQHIISSLNTNPNIISGLLSLSIGIATANSQDKLHRALRLSDKRMYQDKQVYRDNKVKRQLVVVVVKPSLKS